RLVADFPNADCPWYGPVKRSLGIEPHIHDRLFRRGEVQGLLREAGWSDVRTRNILFTSKRVPDVLLPLFRGIDWVGERLPGGRRADGNPLAPGPDGGPRRSCAGHLLPTAPASRSRTPRTPRAWTRCARSTTCSTRTACA